MKRLLLSLIALLGITHIARFFNRNSLTILLYHGVAPLARRSLGEGGKENRGLYNYRGKFIEPAHFEVQMRYFKEHYRVLELDEAVRRLFDGSLPSRALAITFDDGYQNFYTHAFPILKKMNIPATMFLATDFVLRRKPLWVDRLEYAAIKENDALKRFADSEREQRVVEIERRAGTMFTDFEGARAVYAPLALEEIREMLRNGMTFGAHTRSHPILSRIQTERLEDEVIGSKKELENALGRISSTFAYPNGQPGDWTEEVEKQISAAGFRAALTTIEGTNTRMTHPMRLKRIAMDGTDDSPAFASIAAGVRVLLRSIRS